MLGERRTKLFHPKGAASIDPADVERAYDSMAAKAVADANAAILRLSIQRRFDRMFHR